MRYVWEVGSSVRFDVRSRITLQTPSSHGRHARVDQSKVSFQYDSGHPPVNPDRRILGTTASPHRRLTIATVELASTLAQRRVHSSRGQVAMDMAMQSAVVLRT